MREREREYKAPRWWQVVATGKRSSDLWPWRPWYERGLKGFSIYNVWYVGEK